MGKLTIEQAKKMMEAAKNAETNPIDDKFYPESKITTADKIDTGEPTTLPSSKKKKMPEGVKIYSEGGEINVGKGGDYIKDLID